MGIQFVFIGLLFLVLLFMFFFLWGDYMKVLIFMEILSLIFLTVIMFGLKLGVFSLSYFFMCLIFLVCESSMGFLLFIFYISMESEVVKKLVLIQF